MLLATTRYHVVLVEDERRRKHLFAEPELAERVQQPLVVIVRHSPAVLDLAHHVPYTRPVYSLKMYDN